MKNVNILYNLIKRCLNGEIFHIKELYSGNVNFPRLISPFQFIIYFVRVKQ
jgi:hypothetical protein